MRAFDSSTTLTVSEGYDLTNQQHYAKRRCRCACNFLNKRCSFRVWHILLFLLILTLVIALMGLLLAMYGPGTTDLKYSASRGTDSPEVVGGKQVPLILYQYLRRTTKQLCRSLQYIISPCVNRLKRRYNRSFHLSLCHLSKPRIGHVISLDVLMLFSR